MDEMLESVPGQRIGNELQTTFIRSSQTIRPLRDQIVVEPLPWAPSKILEVITKIKPVRGKVLAVGPGCFRLQYKNQSTGEWSFVVPKGLRCESRESKVFRPTDVKQNDIVELGGLEISGYLHTAVRWGNRDVLIVREEDICGVVQA
jgi:co-chaperonin GroES (HSP10)